MPAKMCQMPHQAAISAMPPKPSKKLPHHVLTIAEVETILAQPDLATAQGLRDRALLELLYSTGVRRMEVTRLKCYDVDTGAGSVRRGRP